MSGRRSHEYHLPQPSAQGEAGDFPATDASAPSARDPDLVVNDAVDPDVLASLLHRGALALIGHAAGGALVLAIYATHAPDGAVATWGGVFLLGWLARLAVLLFYHDALPSSPKDLARVHRYWELTTLFSGIVWGLAVATLFPHGGPLHRLGLVLLVISYCLASPATSYAVYLLYAGACFLPIVAQLAFSDLPYRESLAAGISLVFVVSLLVARQDQRLFQRLHALKRRDAMLVQQLAGERNAAQKARRDAEAAHLAKTRFFAAASHDLRQPLHAMALFTRSLLHHPLPEPAMRLVNSVDESIQAMERLFDQILDMDRLDSGGLVAHAQTVPMAEIFRRVRVHVEAVAFDKGLALGFRGGQHAVYADPLLLERVLRNLVSNAIRYTEDGGVLVSCRVRGDQRHVQVWDTGIGMDPQALPRVFDEFYQLEAAQRPESGEYRGLGLGLAIVRRLVAVMRVPLTVRTRLDKGTVFTLVLPSAPPAQTAEPAVARAGDAVPAAGAAAPGVDTTAADETRSEQAAVDTLADARWRLRLTLNGRSVAVVESAPEHAESIARMLRRWAAEVEVCATSTVLERRWASMTSSRGTPGPDLLIVGDQVQVGDTRASLGEQDWRWRAGVDVSRWLNERSGRVIPTVLLVEPAEAGDHRTPGPAQVLEDSGIHRLERPVQANRLRALVAYKLMPAPLPPTSAH